MGPPAASDELVRANIRVKVGDTYTRTGVDDDVRTLYSTGLFTTFGWWKNGATPGST